MILSLLEIFIRSSKEGNDLTLTCDECFLVIDYFVELALEGIALEDIKNLLLRHINHCPDCREHHTQRLKEMEELWLQSQKTQSSA